MKRNHYDYAEIIRIYNTSGPSKAYTHIKERYSVKNPYSVVNRMKKADIYHYDIEKDCFLKIDDKVSDGLFIDLDELCSNSTQVNAPSNNTAPSMENLIKGLIEDRLLQLSHYIHLNQTTKTVLVDQSTLNSDGYKVVIH